MQHMHFHFLETAREIQDEIIALRRHLHQNPELSKKEYETSKYIQSYLTNLGLDAKIIHGTGVVALIEGEKPGPTVGLRADIDALPILEVNDLPFCSQNPNVMHACGHDCHTAAVLGAAKILLKHRRHFQGNIKLIFEPDEELSGGAKHMIEAGVMENPKVDAMFGAHVNPLLPVGSVGILPGKAYASSNPFEITVTGKSSHGAKPHLGIDAVMLAAQILNAIQVYVSRQVDPLDSALITVGTIHGGTQRNILAQEVKMTGIIRTLDPALRKRTVETLPEIVSGIARALGGEASINIITSASGIVNDPAMTELVGNSVRKLLGESSLIHMDKPSMGTEDFGAFLEHAPGSFYQMGIRNPGKGAVHPLHSDQFMVDEDALPLLSALHAQVAFDYLAEASVKKK